MITTADGWKPVFRPTFPGGGGGSYDIINLRYANGACGRVFQDGRVWYIAADTRPGERRSYPSRGAAALAERDLAGRRARPGAAPPLSDWLEDHGLQLVSQRGRTVIGGRLARVAGQAWLMAGGWRDVPLTWQDDVAAGASDPRPTLITFAGEEPGAPTTARPAQRVTFVRLEDGAEVRYRGTVSQSDLFRVLLTAGLLERDDNADPA